jgi:hypothetical protein
MRAAALASGNANAILLADSVSQMRGRMKSSPLPPAKPKLHETRADETVVTEFLRGQQHFQRRAQSALQMLGQNAGSGEAYLFWFKDGVLELEASLDRRVPPEALERALAALPANYQALTLPLAPEQIYRSVRLANDAGMCVGIAAIGVSTPDQAISEKLVADIGRALAAFER